MTTATILAVSHARTTAGQSTAQSRGEIVIGIPYVAAEGVFIPLGIERATTRTRSRFLGFAGARSEAELEGPRSPVRLTTSNPEFFIRGVDPTRYKLYALVSDDEKRKVEVWSSGPLSSTSTLQRSELPIFIFECGPACYRLQIPEPLDPGEYALSPSDTNESFTFGIDPDATLSDSTIAVDPAPGDSEEIPSPSGTGPGPAAPLTNSDIIALRQAGLGDEVIMARINTTDGSYSLETEDLITLKENGISEPVILLMIERSSRR